MRETGTEKVAKMGDGAVADNTTERDYVLVKEMAALSVSISERERNEKKTEQEEEEKLIESVRVKSNEQEAVEADTEDGETSYTTKGPMLRRVLAGHRSSPYQTQSQTTGVEVPRTLNQLNIYTSDENLRQKLSSITASGMSSPMSEQILVTSSASSCAMTGQIMDDPCLLANIFITSEYGALVENGLEQKTGIPALPDMMGVTKNEVGGPRIIIPAKPNQDGTVNAIVLHTPLLLTVDPQLRNIGIWLPQQSLPGQVMHLIVNSKLEIFIQLDVKVPRVIRHVAMVGQGEVAAYMLKQFVELRPFVSIAGTMTGVKGLLEGVTECEIEDALNLVNGKDLTDLLKTYGPYEDSMLMTLCCKKGESSTIRAQVFALVSRILSQKDPKMRSNVVQKNACHLSALDYTTVTNNRRVACFLADLYYVMGKDVSCTDASGNTLLHMMARKGDLSAETLQALLGLRYASNHARKVYSSEAHNDKLYLPIHFAAMSRRCPQNVLQVLQKDLPACTTLTTKNGSAPIHLACQYTLDPTMIATLLYYNRDVVNIGRSDGFTPLHLVASRNDAIDSQIGLIPLDEETQLRIIRLLLDHGADKSMKVEQKYTPYDLVKVKREKCRTLLRLKKNECSIVAGRQDGKMSADSIPPTVVSNGQQDVENMTSMTSETLESLLNDISTVNLDACGGSHTLSHQSTVQEPALSPQEPQLSPYSTLLGNSDPFIGGNCSPDTYTGSPISQAGMTSTTLSDLGTIQGSLLYPASEGLSDGGCNSDAGNDIGGDADLDELLDILGGADAEATIELPETELDFFAKTFYNHPTIQAVMNETEGGQNNL